MQSSSCLEGKIMRKRHFFKTLSTGLALGIKTCYLPLLQSKTLVTELILLKYFIVTNNISRSYSTLEEIH